MVRANIVLDRLRQSLGMLGGGKFRTVKELQQVMQWRRQSSQLTNQRINTE